MEFIFCVFIFCVYSCNTDDDNIPVVISDQSFATTITIKTSLPDAVNESSGLLFFNNSIWTHNDSGGEAQLFQLDKNDASIQTTKKIIAENIDWEDAAQDDEYIYIGDFGNNFGNRQDLKIYKIAKTNLINSDSLIPTEIIHFSYPDQTDFDHEYLQHNFDCEAMISYGDSLYLFSKNHLDLHTRLYSLPKTAGTYIAEYNDRFNAEGLISSASIDEANKLITLLGYNFIDEQFYSFVWLLSGFEDHNFFQATTQKIDIPFSEKTEAIGHLQDLEFLISAEYTIGDNAPLLLLELK